MYDAEHTVLDEATLRALEAQYCSYGDTVHYLPEPEVLRWLRGLVHVRRPRDAVPGPADVVLGRQLRLPQPAPERTSLNASSTPCRRSASQYLHREKVELAALIAQDAEKQVRPQGPCALQRRRRAGGRGLAEAGAQRHGRQAA